MRCTNANMEEIEALPILLQGIDRYFTHHEGRGHVSAREEARRPHRKDRAWEVLRYRGTSHTGVAEPVSLKRC